MEMITGAAMKCGFTGGLVVDYPNSTKAKKYVFFEIPHLMIQDIFFVYLLECLWEATNFLKLLEMKQKWMKKKRRILLVTAGWKIDL